MRELISHPCCRQRSVTARGRTVQVQFSGEMVTASSSLSNFIYYCLSFDFHRPGKTASRRVQAILGTDRQCQEKASCGPVLFLSLTRKSSPMSISSVEPKKCQSVSLACISVYILPTCQSVIGRCLEPS